MNIRSNRRYRLALQRAFLCTPPYLRFYTTVAAANAAGGGWVRALAVAKDMSRPLQWELGIGEYETVTLHTSPLLPTTLKEPT